MTQTSTYDFETRLDHRAHRSAKWSVFDEDVLPLWVADMDFKVAPAITEALHERVDFGVFAYTRQDDELIDIICERMERLYDWKVQPEEVILILLIPSAVSFDPASLSVMRMYTKMPRRTKSMPVAATAELAPGSGHMSHLPDKSPAV